MNPHDKKDVRKAREWSKVEGREQDEFLRLMLSTPQGRRYFWGLLASCGIGHNPFRPDALSMSFTCGEMNVGQRILSDIIRVAPDRYIEMMGEQNDRSSIRGTDADTGTDSNTDDGNQPDFFS